MLRKRCVDPYMDVLWAHRHHAVMGRQYTGEQRSELVELVTAGQTTLPEARPRPRSRWPRSRTRSPASRTKTRC